MMNSETILRAANPDQKFKISFNVYTIRNLPAFSGIFKNEHYEPDKNIIKGTARFLLFNIPSTILRNRAVNHFHIDKNDPEYIIIE